MTRMQMRFLLTRLFLVFFRRAPEVSLNSEETRREELFFSDSVSQYHSDPGAEEPLLSNKTNQPNYTV